MQWWRCVRRVLVARVARALGRCGWSRARRAARWRVRAARGRRRMHATGHTDRSGGGGGGGSWRLPPDETLQVADPKSAKEEVRKRGVTLFINWRSAAVTVQTNTVSTNWAVKVTGSVGKHLYRLLRVLLLSRCLCLSIMYHIRIDQLQNISKHNSIYITDILYTRDAVPFKFKMLQKSNHNFHLVHKCSIYFFQFSLPKMPYSERFEILWGKIWQIGLVVL